MFMHMPRSFGAWLIMLALGLLTPVPGQAQVSTQVEAQPLGVVNLNTASADELIRLPGVGPARARAILELRTRLGHFSRLEELLRVKGIGRATFRKLRPLLALDGTTTLRER